MRKQQEHQKQSQQQQLFGAQPSTSSRMAADRWRADNQKNGMAVNDCGVLERKTSHQDKAAATPNLISFSPMAAILVLCVVFGFVMHAGASPVVSNEPSFDDPETLQMYDNMFERNIRAPRQKFIRFGRAGQKFIRFGRSSWDYNAPEPSLIGNEVEAFDYQPAQIRRFISSPKRAQKFIRFG